VSALDTWLTPRDFFQEIDHEFKFSREQNGQLTDLRFPQVPCPHVFDPCPPDNNLELFDGLKADWAYCTFCNPPYSTKLKNAFLLKGLAEHQLGKTVVFLLPVSTGSKIFHNTILKFGSIRFLKGRLPFEGIDRSGNWINPGCGMFKLQNIPQNAKKINRSGQNDSMLWILDHDF
jgi:hypothetical protein